MKIEESLKEITNKFEKQVKGKTVTYFSNEYYMFRNFFEKKLTTSLLKNINAQILVKNMDIMLKYTAFNNREWLLYDSIQTRKNFLSQFIKNIRYFKYPEYLSELTGSLISSGKYKQEDIFIDELLDFIVDTKLDSESCRKLFNQMNERKQNEFIKKILNKKVIINFAIFDLSKEQLNIIKENIDSLLEYTNLLALRFLLNEDKEIVGKINKYINDNPSRLIESIMDICEIDTTDNRFKKALEFIITDVCENENTKLSDLDYISKGSYSKVFIIKDKIIKLGSRKSEIIPNNPYILKPLLRRKIEDTFIEITQRVDTNLEITKQQLYELYKKIRENKLIWTDVRFENVGKLTIDNKIHWKENLNPNDEDLMLKKRNSTIQLSGGELVILDADYIYEETDEDIEYPINGFYKEFEARYQEEARVIEDNHYQEDTEHKIKVR